MGVNRSAPPREAKSRARRHPAVHLAPAPDPLPIWITRTPEAVLPAGRLRARTKVHAQSPGRPAPAPQEPCMPRYRSIHVSKRHNTPEMVRRRLHIRHTPIRHGRNPVRLPLPTRLPGGGPLLRQERSHVRPSRPAGHGTPPSAAVSSAGAGRPGQARQETHRPTHATAPELRDAGPLHGTAGTAPAEPKAAHTRTAAQGPSKRAATPPAAQDIREPRRIAPGAAAPMKGQETRKRAPRPKQGGADHG